VENARLGLDFIEKEILPDLDNLAPSLFYGKAGLAVMYSNAIAAGLITEIQHYKYLINKCFEKDAHSLDVIYGIAGQAIAALKCSEHIEPKVLKDLMSNYSAIIINAQNSDGSWSWAMHDKKGLENKTGFGYGIAGICYSLLVYGALYKKESVIISAEKGLKYLIRQAKRKKEVYEWTNSDKDKRVCTWWCNGAPGIALSFLKAYEITRKKIYLRVVNRSLHSIPKYLIYQDLSQCHGLSGLGDIYIHTYRITQNKEWLDRATWIGNLIMALRIKHNDNESYWMVEKQDFPTADFMIGNSGVLLFMQRLYTLSNPTLSIDTIY
jgi:lantibiotic modifying enzyme